MTHAPNEPGNPEKLRVDIDRGRTSDKVRNPDPALSPLGTDDEAGGHPNRVQQVRLARRQEDAPVAKTAQGPEQSSGTHYDEPRSAKVGIAGVMVFVVALIVAALILAMQ